MTAVERRDADRRAQAQQFEEHNQPEATDHAEQESAQRTIEGDGSSEREPGSQLGLCAARAKSRAESPEPVGVFLFYVGAP